MPIPFLFLGGEVLHLYYFCTEKNTKNEFCFFVYSVFVVFVRFFIDTCQQCFYNVNKLFFKKEYFEVL